MAADQIADAVAAVDQFTDDGEVRVHVAGRGGGDDGDMHPVPLSGARKNFQT
jgi:hypothetical protein